MISRSNCYPSYSIISRIVIVVFTCIRRTCIIGLRDTFQNEFCAFKMFAVRHSTRLGINLFCITVNLFDFDFSREDFFNFRRSFSSFCTVIGVITVDQFGIVFRHYINSILIHGSSILDLDIVAISVFRGSRRTCTCKHIDTP